VIDMEAGAEQSTNSAEQPPNRRALFKPGQSGNPKGRPPKSQALRELERVTREQAAVVLEKLAGPALKVLQKAINGKDQQLAVKAAIDVLDRTQGKAVQKIDAAITGPEVVTTVTPELLRAAAMRLLASQATDAVEAQEVARAGAD
jgi:hypothetical protein